MKKTILIVALLAIIIISAFANGSPEEQQTFFENLMTNTKSNVSIRTTNQSSALTGTSTGSEIISRDMATLERLYQYVEKNYLFDIDYDAVYEAMATALFDALGDKYSYYVTAEESEDYEEDVTGQYGGLGIYFSKTYVKYQDPDDDSTIYCKITQVFPNTPSSRSGLRAGDLIIEIDGTSVVDLEATDCAKMMKGVPGTTVELTIRRNGSEFSLVITREKITVPTVEYEMLENNVGYLRILEFSRNTYSAITDALKEMIGLGMKGLVMDLRDNPGGDVDATLAIADLFISGKRLLDVNYKDSSKDVRYVANESILVPADVEVAILVNGGTASSAEILTTCMKDNGRAVVFGSTTYGKGIMQQITSFGKGYTSVTIASFKGPSGNEIHKVGVNPNYEVEDLYVLDEEVEAYTELLNGTEISEFVDQHPDFNPANIAIFAQMHADTGLREVVLRVMVRNEYYSRMNSDEQPLVDMEYDVVFKAAFDYLLSDGEVVPMVVGE